MNDNAEGYFLTPRRDALVLQPLPRTTRPRAPTRGCRRSGLEISRGLPPAFVITAEFDPLRDQGVAYANGDARTRARRVDARTYDGMFHGFLEHGRVDRRREGRVRRRGRAPSTPRSSGRSALVAVIDLAGFVADLKDHAVEHGFHVHDERHFVESYSLRQNWEVDLHPEEGCEGPLDLYLSLEVDPRVLLGFEDAVIAARRARGPARRVLPAAELHLGAPAAARRRRTCSCWPPSSPAIGGPDLPLEVSAIDSYPSATDAPETSLRVVAHQRVSLLRIRDGEEVPCETLDRCLVVSRYLLERAGDWLG